MRSSSPRARVSALEIEEVLRPARMRTRGLYAEGALERFLEGTRREGFGATRRFARVLTLELLARKLGTTPTEPT